jgi:hypothetical protein
MENEVSGLYNTESIALGILIQYSVLLTWGLSLTIIVDEFYSGCGKSLDDSK